MLKHSKYYIQGKLNIIKDSGPTADDQIQSVELYERNPCKSGIYIITNKDNGKKYIGQSRNMEIRKKHHESDLLKRVHKSSLMQEDFDAEFMGQSQYPEIKNFDELFEFTVLMYCRPSELTFYENILINALHPEYNRKKVKNV